AWNGAIHGGIATVVGAFVVLVLLALLGLFVTPFASLGIFLAGVVVLFVQAIPGAIAGAIGGWLKGRRPSEAVEAEPAR
ncbi:MAG: DUF5518 domain-containing protein, partial [Halobacteriota archaeon]